MATWIKNPLRVWTGTAENADGGIVVAGDTIVELVSAGKAPTTPYENSFNADKLLLLPGLVNCHHHFYQTLTRACPPALNKGLFAWLRALYPLWAKLDQEAIAVSTELALAELMLSGCSLVCDHHYVFSESLDNAIDIQLELVERFGVRAVLTRGSMSLGTASGGLPPEAVVQSDDTILQDSERLLKKVAQQTLAQLALAPCSPFSVSSELMRESAALAREYGALLHTHLAETEDENQFCLQRFNLRPLDYLETVGWLNADVWLAHGIHFNHDEIQRLGEAGLGICHCPSSNMLLGSGICPVLALEEAGVAIGLGVDGSASNDASNMLQELRQAFLLQRLHSGAEQVSHEQVLSWATSGGARVLNQHAHTGRIAVGMKADLALFELDALRFSGAGDPLAALLLCGAHQVKHLMVNGAWRVLDGDIPGLDLEQLKWRHAAAAKKLLA